MSVKVAPKETGMKFRPNQLYNFASNQEKILENVLEAGLEIGSKGKLQYNKEGKTWLTRMTDELNGRLEATGKQKPIV